MSKASRKKARRAKLLVDAAPQQQVDEAEHSPEQSPTQSSSPETQRATSSDEEHKDNVLLLSGHKFYLARSLSSVRRAELRELITQNGGVVVAVLEPNAVELVDRKQIQTATDENWVAAEFVEDSIRDGELKKVVRYMAKTPLQVAMEDLRWTPSGRKSKTFYTAEDDATMLRFIHDEHPVYFGRPSVPERIWRVAAAEKLLGDRTFNSMHQRYRTRLVKLTKKERAAVYEKAGMANPETEKTATEKKSQQQEESKQDEGEDEEEQAEEKSVIPAKRKADDLAESRPRTPEPEETIAKENDQQETRNASDGESEIEGRAKKRRKKSSSGGMKEEALEAIAREDPAPKTPEKERPIKTSSPPAVVQVKEAEASTAENTGATNEEDAEQSETVKSGEVFRGYWKRIVSDPLERPHIERFFTPPSPSAAEIFQSSIITSTSSVHRTPQRSGRLSHPGYQEEPLNTTPTGLLTPAQRRARRKSTGSTNTPGSRTTPGTRTPGSRTPGSRIASQTPQQDLLSQLEEMVGQRMTPPRRKSLDRLIPVSEATEDEAKELIKRLQFDTAQDASAVCSALYWASGDASVARDFLLGQAPPEMWSPRDDQLLVDFIRQDVTEADIANARHRGVFENMLTKRSARDILRRIQFLL